MKLACNVEVALRKVGEHQLSGRMGRNLDYKGPNLMGHLKYGPNWHKNSGVSAILGANDDKYEGGAAGNMRSEASFKCGTHNLTTKEWEERRRKGLCFHCAQPYSPTHKCTNPKLRVMLLGEDEIVNEDGEIIVAEAEEEIVGGKKESVVFWILKQCWKVVASRRKNFNHWRL
ncbi:putative retrotransposon gag domain-containing protein [Sesbania bispinosa]|nr:putative retrotransposon gag domain-containing protein [Sesbania bispinosa]